MTRWSAITRTRRSCSALAYGSRSTAAAEDLNRLVHHERDATPQGVRTSFRLCRPGVSDPLCRHDVIEGASCLRRLVLI